MIVWSVIFVLNVMMQNIKYPFHNYVSHTTGYGIPSASNEIIDENGYILTAGLEKCFNVSTTFYWFPL